MSTFAIPNEKNGTPAEVAQLVEHNLAKVGVASSSLVFCSKKQVSSNADFRFEKYHPTGFNHMSVVLVHKAGFFLFIPRHPSEPRITRGTQITVTQSLNRTSVLAKDSTEVIISN